MKNILKGSYKNMNDTSNNQKEVNNLAFCKLTYYL